MIETRIAVAGDLDVLAGLFSAYRKWYCQDEVLGECRQFLSDRMEASESKMFVAEVDGDIAGFTQLYPLFSSVSMARIWLLNDLFVDEAFRRQGVGRELLRAASEFARSEGAIRLELATAHDNTTAQQLYESSGWDQEVEFRHYQLKL